MDTRRLFLLLALGLILVLLWTKWQSEHPAPAPAAQPAAVPSARATNAAASPATIATSAGSEAAVTANPPPTSLRAPGGATIKVRTDVLDLEVALRGAAIVKADLLRYPEKEGGKVPVALLTTATDGFLVATLGLAGTGIPNPVEYSAPKHSYQLAPGAQTLEIPFTWRGNGITVTRTLTLRRGSYAVKVTSRVASTAAPVSIVPSVSLAGRNPPVATHFWDHFLPKYWAFRGPAYYDGSDYEEVSADSLVGKPIDQSFSGGWIGSVRQYFVAVAIPSAKAKPSYFGRALDDDGYDVGFRLAPLQVAPGSSATTVTTLFLGPKRQDILGKVAPGLARTVDYGKARIISGPMFSVLSWIHGLLGNWGWSIIVLVLLIKAVFYWPQRISARSMAKMRKLQPRIKHLQERYKDDKQKLSQATMELYRKEGANPVSGCLPMLIQIPIFFGLFYVLIHSVELRQATWFWIRDLSAPDPYYILPALFAVVSLVQFRLQPQAVDNAQAKMMMFMPLLFTFMYAIFPAGLVLYYLLNTVLNVAIQWQVNRELGMPMQLFKFGRKKAD